MKFDIKRWKMRDVEGGYVATFDVLLDDAISIRGISLLRPRTPGKLWLNIPRLEAGGRQTVAFPPPLRDAIGERAVAMYNAATGLNLCFEPPASQLPVHADVLPDAGLRKMLGAAEEDSLQMAGI